MEYQNLWIQNKGPKRITVQAIKFKIDCDNCKKMKCNDCNCQSCMHYEKYISILKWHMLHIFLKELLNLLCLFAMIEAIILVIIWFELIQL